jgi:hypothetical protein
MTRRSSSSAARSKSVTKKTGAASDASFQTPRRVIRHRETTRDRKAMPLLRSLADTARIHLLVKNNPRREGSVPYSHWEQHMKEGVTLARFFKNGGSWLHLRADIARGHVLLRK